jgi:DNA-directed RNA polymerase subunit N (RpoN/RPB10)
MSHIWMSLVTHMNESCHTYESVMSHIWMIHGTPRMSYVTHKNESCYTCERAMSHIWMSHMAHMKESCHKYEWVSNALCYRYSDIILRTWICHVAWHIPSSSTARLQYVHRVTHMNELCHAYEYVMSHVWTSHVTRMNESRHTNEWFMSHVWISHITCMQSKEHLTQS